MNTLDYIPRKKINKGKIRSTGTEYKNLGITVYSPNLNLDQSYSEALGSKEELWKDDF